MVGGGFQEEENVNRWDETKACFLLSRKLIQPDLERSRNRMEASC